MVYKIKIKNEDNDWRDEQHTLEGDIIKALGEFSRKKLDSGDWGKAHPENLTLILKPDLEFATGGFKYWTSSRFAYRPLVEIPQDKINKIPDVIKSLYEFENILEKEAPKDTVLTNSYDITVPVELELYSEIIIPYLGVDKFVEIMRSNAERKWEEVFPNTDPIEEIAKGYEKEGRGYKGLFRTFLNPWIGGLIKMDKIILKYF